MSKGVVSKVSRKFYVVWTGRRPVVYSDWPETSQQIAGYAGAKFKSFPSFEEAEAAYREDSAGHIGSARRQAGLSPLGLDPRAVAVDAACSGVPGPMEYRGVVIATKKLLFRMGPFDEGTNNIGEFLAVVHALALLKRQGASDVPVYTDSATALSWVRNRACRTKLVRTPCNARIFSLIERATLWLRTNNVTNPVIKWETADWGEIPADYGRK